MTRQTLQLETSMFVRSWGLALNSTSHVHRPIHTGRHIHNLKTNDALKLHNPFCDATNRKIASLISFFRSAQGAT